ncbi:MAG: tetratricopeptide repeat protein [Spirochaetaceae bacterium]
MPPTSEDLVFPADTSPLERISYFSLPREMEREIGDVTLDPDIPLPVEPPPGQENFQLENLSWEMIVSAMLKIFAYKPDHEHIEYYRSFVHSVQPNIVAEMTQTGIVKAKEKEFELAEEIFRSMVNFAPEHPGSWVNLALVLEQKGEDLEKHYKQEEAEEYLDTAFTVYSKALEYHPNSADVHYNAGHFFIKRGNIYRAKQELSRFLQLSDSTEHRSEVEELLQRMDSHNREDKTFAEAYDFIRIGEEDRGITLIREFLQSNPEVWNGWFLLGWGLRKKEEWKGAKEAFIRSLELNPEHTDTLNELGICSMETGEHEASRKYLEKALQLEPENTKIISNLAVLSLKKGDIEMATRFFRTVLELDPEDPVAARFIKDIDGETYK